MATPPPAQQQQQQQQQQQEQQQQQQEQQQQQQEQQQQQGEPVGYAYAYDYVDDADEVAQAELHVELLAGPPSEPDDPRQFFADVTDAIDGWREVRLSVIDPPSGQPNWFVGNTHVGVVPPTGLETFWVVRAVGHEIRSTDAAVTVTRNQLSTEVSWIATFVLVVPVSGPSVVHSLEIADDGTPVSVAVTISVGGRVIRELTIEIGDSEATQTEEVIVDAAGADVRPPHEWTTPPYIVSIHVGDEKSAYVNAQLPTRSVAADEDWPTPAEFSNPMAQLLAAGDRWRVSATNFLDDIGADELEQRLQYSITPQSWDDDQSSADEVHATAWQQAAQTRQLKELAARGFQLFEILFPRGSERRSVIDELAPGSLISIRWDVSNGAAGGIPWSLLYTKDVGMGGVVEGMGFFGLRFRLEHIKNKRRNSGLFLGTSHSRPPTSLLYWGSDEVDSTGMQSKWQRSWQQAPTGAFDVRPISSGSDPKEQVLAALRGSGDGPAVVYLYCQCGVSGTGSEIVLGFDESVDGLGARIEDWELAPNDIPNGPLVFANACDTGKADAYNVNMLEQHFIKRGCRAFIGTQTKVPVVLASRVSRVFFHFFTTRVDSKAMHAGEALVQTRRFLWRNYRNLGGLLYSYVDQYRLVLADPDELDAVVKG